MTDNGKKPGEEPWVNFRRLRLFVVYPVLGIFGLGFCYLWLGPAFHGLSAARERRAELAPLLEQAKAAGLSYKDVLADPAASEGKFVLWCVQNRSEAAVNVDGDETKRLAVSNYPRMPLVSGSKHQSCEPMLLLVEKKTAGRPLTVFFKEAL
ncbi:MAG: hypothetical protein NDI60_04560 [Elusimicrobiales bacterium]|nr:hypothetical protein [Elusimicrobiales bacterium]